MDYYYVIIKRKRELEYGSVHTVQATNRYGTHSVLGLLGGQRGQQARRSGDKVIDVQGVQQIHDVVPGRGRGRRNQSWISQQGVSICSEKGVSEQTFTHERIGK